MGVYIYQSGVQKELKNAYIGEVWTPGSNTLAYYPLKTDTKDYSGNGRDGTNSNVTFSGGIATFNGTNAVVTVTDAAWQRPTSNFSILAWFRTTTTGNGIIVSKMQKAPSSLQDMFYETGIQSGVLFGGFATGNSWYCSPTSQPSPSSTTVTTNVWHLLALTNNGTTKTLYYDATQIAQATANTTSSTHGIPLTIGNCTVNNQNVWWFNGNISRVILESKTRSQQKIADYYNNTKSSYGL